MKYLIPLLMVFFFSCRTPQVITKTETVTKYRDTTIYVKSDPIVIDSIIYVPIPYYKDSVVIRDSVRIIDKNSVVSMTKIVGIIQLTASARYRSTDYGDWLSVDANAHLTDSAILHHYYKVITWQDSITIANAVMEKTTKTEDTVILPPEKYVSWFSKFTHWYFGLSALAIGIYLFLKYRLFAIRPKSN